MVPEPVEKSVHVPQTAGQPVPRVPFLTRAVAHLSHAVLFYFFRSLVDNDLKDPSMKVICGALKRPDCRMEALR